MTAKTMNDLLITFMQDVYYAERQILKALPKMAKASENEELKNALTHHRGETEGQIERLQKAFDALGKRARGWTCEAINGLIEEGDEIVEAFEAGTREGRGNPGLRTGGRALRDGALRHNRRLGQSGGRRWMSRV